ncbi:hypothetical protein ACGF8B_25760 [Streptomyces sp. NPDC047917]|uniref:hypothetical protein n=1 Tax=Streptomyces sp. NPDC047917 TaxID=3365491 RepID=UPI003717F3EE
MSRAFAMLGGGWRVATGETIESMYDGLTSDSASRIDIDLVVPPQGSLALRRIAVDDTRAPGCYFT